LPLVVEAVLPRKPEDVSKEISVVIAGALTSNQRVSLMQRFKARREKVSAFLSFLMAHHAAYKMAARSQDIIDARH
jgi:hypothetical protein